MCMTLLLLLQRSLVCVVGGGVVVCCVIGGTFALLEPLPELATDAPPSFGDVEAVSAPFPALLPLTLP